MGDVNDFGSKFAQTYKQDCDGCGRAIEVSTQKDDNPEYYTSVFVKCPNCGTSVAFSLPVN